MKILDRYILTTYLKTFISVFLILILIFILQTLWLYIKELAGKDLDLFIIIKVLLYILPSLIPLILPLTILVSSIMVFGSFAENYEFAAMKSTGISLQRAMAGLSIFIVGLAITTFFFSNNVIPWSKLKSYNLRRNIAKLKPAMAIAEGQFNEIMNYNIKVESKSGDNDQYLEDVIIHIKGPDGRQNATTIKSKTGELVSSEDSDVLKLVLYDGNYYSDISPSKPEEYETRPFAKSTFEKYIINIDLSDLNNVDLDEETRTDKYDMLSINGLQKAIDSLENRRENDLNSLAKILIQRSNVVVNEAKSLKGKIANTAVKENKPTDSIYEGEILDLFNTRKKLEMVELASRGLVSAKQIISTKKNSFKKSRSELNKHYISLNEKFALGFACIILFFVGAPLGALIRKGGIGLPMVIAILLFLTYHFIGIFATNSAKNGEFSPIFASWFSTLIMLPLSIFLTRRATADRKIFEGDGLFEFLKKIFKIKKKEVVLDTSTFDIQDSEYEVLNSYENNKLISIVKNHKEFGYRFIYRNTALSILNKRGITDEQLKFSGNFNNREYEQKTNLRDKFEEDIKLSFILYIISLFTWLPGGVLNNNSYPTIGTVLLILGIITQVLFIIAFVKTCLSEYNYRKFIGKGITVNYILIYIIGIPLYFVVYFLFEKELKRDFDLEITKNNQDQTNAVILDEYSKSKAIDYKQHALFSIVLYTIGSILLISFFIFNNNKLQYLASASIQLSIVSYFLFFVYYFKSFFNLHKLYNHNRKKKPSILIFLLGVPLYVIVFVVLSGKIKQDLGISLK
ncbi:LptF/LptG family permease [Seonamhaeicola sp. ML3]|uniref:LptF/LptG family permease n=1 Tax=Seonamhaeicola sp. ML3 TaxID=2937786 RepID=UPI00200C0599|nr:LptF/LptG family permease [Seonamhaeicola sp. ML3]